MLSRDVQGLGVEPDGGSRLEVLPSGAAAWRLLGGDWSAIWPVIGWTGVRAAAIAAGLLAVGEQKKLVRKGVAGAVAVELVVLAHVWALRCAAAQGK